jgi:predicted metal-dependent phosphoesterase TrpH
MPFGIRPSNVRVCHSTTRAFRGAGAVKFAVESAVSQVRSRKLVLVIVLLLVLDSGGFSITSMSTTTTTDDWIKVDLHIHTLEDPKDVIDYSAHELLVRAKALGFGVLAITLHDAVFDRAEVFADAARMGILLIPAAEVRLRGADVIVLNVSAAAVTELRDFDDLRRLRARRGESVFTIAPHPFYVLGASIGNKIVDLIDCFDAIELCHFHKGLLNPNRRAVELARRFGKPLIATSDAHQLHAFGRHYTSIPRPDALTIENVFATLRRGTLRLTSPPPSIVDLISAFYFIFVAHPYRVRRQGRTAAMGKAQDVGLESKTQT